MPVPLIAVINDEPTFIELLRELLTEEGYRVVGAYEADQAYEVIQSQRPHLVILDNRLSQPDSGWRLLAIMRQHPELRHIPVIFCSADKRFLDEKREQLQRLHTAPLDKPFDLDDLLTTVRNLLGPAQDRSS